MAPTSGRVDLRCLSMADRDRWLVASGFESFACWLAARADLARGEASVKVSSRKRILIGLALLRLAMICWLLARLQVETGCYFEVGVSFLPLGCLCWRPIESGLSGPLDCSL